MLSHLDDVITKHRSLLQRMPFTQVVDKARYRVLVDETTVIDTVHGYQMYVDPEDTSVSRRLWRDGDFQPTLTEYFKSVIEPGMTVVDVGAHIGYFSLLFGKLVGTGGWVRSFEPMPRNFSLLSRNITLNEYDHITADRLAIATDIGEQHLAVKRGNTGGHSIVEQKQQDSDTVSQITVETKPLDSVVDAVDVLKVDVEGAEDQVLRGGIAVIEAHRPLIVIEWNPDDWHVDAKTTLAPLFDLGYGMYDPATNRELTIRDANTKAVSDVVLNCK